MRRYALLATLALVLIAVSVFLIGTSVTTGETPSHLGACCAVLIN